jgi:DNA-binding protein HU-beta
VPNKAEFTESLAERLGEDRKRAAVVLDAVIDTIYAHVAKGERVTLTGFGIFERRERAARVARNPATGASVRVKKTAVPAFRAGAEFKAITSGAKKAPGKSVAKKAAAKTTAKAPGKRAAAKAAPAKKVSAKAPPTKATARKAAATNAPAKKAPAKRATAKKAPA